MAKNSGPTLTSKIRGAADVIPPWARRFVKYTITDKSVDAKTPLNPDALTGTILASELRQTVTDERRKINTELDATELPVSRTGQQVLANGQIGTVTEQVDDAAQTLSASALLMEGEVENVGDISLLRKIEVASVFDATLYAKEKPDLVPIKFRGSVPLATTRVDSAGTAAAPTLGATDVSKSSEQIRVGVVRNTTQNRDASVLPATLTGYEISGDGQLVTVTEILDDASQTISESATQIDAAVDNLGDGLTLKQTKTVASVFDATLYAKERPEVLPPKFRAALPSTTTRVDSAGTAAAPSLSSGDVSKTSEQTKVGVVRNTTVTRDVSSPGTLTGKRYISEFGGDTANVAETIVTDGAAAPTLDDGTVAFEDETLGDGTSHRTLVSRSAGSWPTLVEWEWDPRALTNWKIEKTFVAPSTVSSAPSSSSTEYTEVKGYDKLKSIQIVTRVPSTIVGKTIVRNIARNYSFPKEVVRCEYKTAIKRTNFTSSAGGVNNEVSSLDIGLDIAYKGGYSGPVESRITEKFFDSSEVALPTIFKYYTVGGSLTLGYVMSGISLFGASIRTFEVQESLHGFLNPAAPVISNIASGPTLTGPITYSAIGWDLPDGIPASTPEAYNTGEWIVVDVNMEHWRGPIYVRSVIEVKVPDIPIIT